MEDSARIKEEKEKIRLEFNTSNERTKELRTGVPISTEIEDSDESDEAVTSFSESVPTRYNKHTIRNGNVERSEIGLSSRKEVFGQQNGDSEDSYRSVGDLNHVDRSA